MTTLKPEVLEKYVSPYFFETGTSNGEALEMALQFDFEKLFSVEIDETLYHQNLEKFKDEINSGRVNLFLGDTIEIMPEILNSHINKKTTFWLDAHVDSGPSGIKKCPLYEEIDFIKNLDYKNHVILIDDIRCFGGGWWGDGINLETLKEKILEINQDYSFLREDGYIKEDVLVANIENYDSFEDTLRTYLKKMNKIKGIIQIGANIGQEVEIFEKFTKNILLVEPLPYCKEILKTKYPDYLFLPFAIGTEEGTKKFHVASNGGASSSILKPKLHNKFYPDVDFFLTMDVTVKKFVNIVEEFNIDLDRFNVLFIDTQGSDLDCIKSFESKIRCFDLIVCEIIDVELYENNPNLLHYISYLEKYDFKLSELHGYDGKVGNCFFIKKLL